MERMAKLYNNKPLQQSPRRKALAVAFALVMAAAWQPAPAPAQIEVDVLTTAPESATPTPASGQDRSAEEAAEKIRTWVAEQHKGVRAVIQIDRSYT